MKEASYLHRLIVACRVTLCECEAPGFGALRNVRSSALPGSELYGDNRKLADHPKLARAIEAYGGISLWRRLKHVVLRVESLGGILPVIKGLGNTFARPELVTVSPADRRVEFHDYPRPGARAQFDNGSVSVYDAEGAEVFREGAYRQTFRGLAKNRRWSDADAVYFFGYALVTYLSVPFILPGIATGITEVNDGLRVTARFPDGWDTHSLEQEFWFDSSGLLVRHDYRADVVGWWAAGAHFTSDYTIVAGLPIARKRHVFGRLLGAVTPVPVLNASIQAVDVCCGPPF